MSNVIYRSLTNTPPIAARTIGDNYVKVDGRSVLDMSSGACTASLGYDNAWIITSMKSALDHAPSVFSGSFGNTYAEQAADILHGMFEKRRPGWFGGVIFQTTGSEAVDLACKLAAQYQAEGGKPYRTQFITQEHAFHGVTLLPAALSAHYKRYAMMDTYEGAACALYANTIRHPMTTKHDRTSTRFIKELDSVLSCQRYEGDPLVEHAALIVEPVSGPQLGIYPQKPEWLDDMIRRCHEDDVLVIYDEVLCGSGRCGYLTNAELQTEWPDIIVLGKGISGGYFPVSPIIVSKKVRDRIAAGSGQTMFGTTYSAHPIGCAAVSGVLQFFEAYGV
jgi:adenosylmethionine-8-amino-7-oxononanoate aminotransferase